MGIQAVVQNAFEHLLSQMILSINGSWLCVIFQFQTRDLYDDALRELEEDGDIIRTGNNIRICS